MNSDRMVLGVLDISGQMPDASVVDKYRDFTISWSRYDYRGEIIEATTVDQILDRAADDGASWCLVLPYGHIVAERWKPEHWQGKDFLSVMQDRIQSEAFLVAGTITGDADRWYGFADECLLVNLDLYRQLDRPRFDEDGSEPVEVPLPESRGDSQRPTALVPTAESSVAQPVRFGWHFIAASLRAGFPVVGLDESLRGRLLDLSAKSADRTRALSRYLGDGIAKHDPQRPDPDLSEEQVAFLNLVQPQTRGARNGVFLWNIEAYTDIETPREDFQSPLDSVYCVAAGFKPNRILQTHGWDASTRVVFYDYSPNALAIRKYMVEHWDGADFPAFVRHLFQEFPHPQTFYQLWDGLTPDEVQPQDMERMWQRELERWGGAAAFQDHWQDYVTLPHEYVDCNIMADPQPLLATIRREPNAVLWWSNAFFTVYGNWFCSLEQRKRIYDAWLEGITGRNPDLYLFGSDYNNVNVNATRAGEYWEAYQQAGSDWLVPCRLSKTEMRM